MIASLFISSSLVSLQGLTFLVYPKNSFMDTKDKKEEDRPIAYPKPTESDQQLKNQPEYIDQEPNSYNKEISDVPGQQNPQPPQTREG